MGILNWIFGKKKCGIEANPKKTCNQPDSGSSGFYVQDTRTPEEHVALKKTFLHPAAEGVSHGICAVGQADNEKSIVELGEYTNGVRYLATLDNVCCPSCWPLDGEIFSTDIDKRPPIPRHDDCRCLYLPKAKTWRDFGIDMDDLPDAGRPYILADYQYTYKKDPTKRLKTPRRIIRKAGHFKGTAEEWIRSLPKKEQRQFFATDLAYSLWANGKIKGIDLLDGRTWELRNDEELRLLFE